jgi:hypothetical protein
VILTFTFRELPLDTIEELDEGEALDIVWLSASEVAAVVGVYCNVGNHLAYN